MGASIHGQVESGLACGYELILASDRCCRNGSRYM